MSRSALLYLDDLIASAEKIGRLTSSCSPQAFVTNEAVFDAVLFNLQVIGEAVIFLSVSSADEATFIRCDLRVDQDGAEI